jgi:hypothetical protein
VASACATAVLLCGCGASAADGDAAENQAGSEQTIDRAAPKPGAPATETAGQAEWQPEPTTWHDRDFPDGVSDARFERPEQVLAAVAGELVSLGGSEGGERAILRLVERGEAVLGEIAVQDLPDDSVAAQELRVTLREHRGGWQIVSLQERWICRRGASRDLCL